MKTHVWKYALVALLAIASRVQADEAGTSSSTHRESVRVAAAPTQTVAIAPSGSTGVEGDSNSGAMAPDFANAPQSPCPDTQSASPAGRIGSPGDASAQQVWVGP